MMSSVMPSEKYSCSGSPDMLLKGSTAIDGLSGLRRSRVGLRRARGRSGGSRVPFPDADRPVDVLDVHLAAVLEADVDAVADALVDDRGDANAAGLGQRLQARGDVDAVAVDVVALDDDVAEIDADAERDLRAGGGLRRDRPLHREGAFDRVDDAAELDQRAVADQLDDAAVVGGDGGVEDGLAVALQGGQRAGLVAGHHAGIADDVGGEDRREPARGALFSLNPGASQENPPPANPPPPSPPRGGPWFSLGEGGGDESHRRRRPQRADGRAGARYRLRHHRHARPGDRPCRGCRHQGGPHGHRPRHGDARDRRARV